jgi:hypothetical protein
MSKNMDKKAELEAQAGGIGATSNGYPQPTMDESNQDTWQDIANTLPFAPVETIDLISYNGTEILPVSCTVGSCGSRTDEHSAVTTTSTALLRIGMMKQGATYQSILKLSTSTTSRKSSKDAHCAYQNEQELKNMFKSAFQVGTILYRSMQSGENTLKKFSTMEKVAFEINKLFGVELVSGYRLKEGIKNGRRSLSPPRRGPISRIVDVELKALASLVFTAESIEQANCAEDCLEWPELMSRVGKIMNGCL